MKKESNRGQELSAQALLQSSVLPWGDHGAERLPRVKCCQGTLPVSSSWSPCGIIGLHMRKPAQREEVSCPKPQTQGVMSQVWLQSICLYFFFCCLFSFHHFCHVSVGGGKVTQRLDSLNLLCPLMTKGEQFSPECSAELQMLGCCFLTPCVLFLPNWLCL